MPRRRDIASENLFFLPIHGASHFFVLIMTPYIWRAARRDRHHGRIDILMRHDLGFAPDRISTRHGVYAGGESDAAATAAAYIDALARSANRSFSSFDALRLYHTPAPRTHIFRR